MWNVSARFLNAIPRPHKLGTVVTCTPPGGSPVTLNLSSGTWQAQAGQMIRRTAPLVVDGGSAVYDLLSTPGAVVSVTHGFRWSDSASELIPVITGELSQAANQYGDGTVSFTVADFGQRVQRCAYLTAFTPAATTKRTDAITTAVQQAVPGVTVINRASDTGKIGTTQTWTTRADLINDLATDGNMEAFFLPDGSFLIRDVPQLSDSPVGTLATGISGTVKAVARARPLDKLYNTVTVTPSSTDGSQTWTQVIVQVTDTADPRHPNYIGVAPYTWQAPTVMSQTEADKVAQIILSKIQGSTETLQLELMSNPAFEPGDVVRVAKPTDAGLTTVKHLLESVTGDLAAGSMTAATRAKNEVLTP